MSVITENYKLIRLLLVLKKSATEKIVDN